MRRSRIDGGSTLVGCLMGRMRILLLSWITLDDTNKRFVRRIKEAEIEEALKRMKRGKAMRPDGIPIEAWRCLGARAIVWLVKLFNLIFRENKIPKEWTRSILVPIFKNKGDVQTCTNYRGIKLMSHTMKL
jgi:hypothetical protein